MILSLFDHWLLCVTPNQWLAITCNPPINRWLLHVTPNQSLAIICNPQSIIGCKAPRGWYGWGRWSRRIWWFRVLGGWLVVRCLVGWCWLMYRYIAQGIAKRWWNGDVGQCNKPYSPPPCRGNILVMLRPRLLAEKAQAQRCMMLSQIAAQR